MDAVRANVEIVRDEKIGEDLWILAAKITYPKELSSSLYVPQIKVYAFRHHPGNSFFIKTSGHAHVNDQDRFLVQLIEAAKQTNY